MVSRFRCPIDIIGTTNIREQPFHLSWGRTPVRTKSSTDRRHVLSRLQVAKEIMKLKSGDNVVITGGLINGKRNTNTIKVETIGDNARGNIVGSFCKYGK